MFGWKRKRTAAPQSPELGRALIPEPTRQSIPAMTTLVGEHLLGTAITRIQSDLGAIQRQMAVQGEHMHALNEALGEFREKLVVPLRQELAYLRYNLGDRVNHATTDLSVYVERLDQVLWGALRAQGLSDADIRKYREEHGMQPEAPRGYELEAQMRELEDLRHSNAELVAQNRRLIATMSGHQFAPTGAKVWEYHETCDCEVCIEQRTMRKDAEAEASRCEASMRAENGTETERCIKLRGHHDDHEFAPVAAPVPLTPARRRKRSR